jgi:hypothetical protein
MVELVERRKVDVVCISATPPAAVMHARYLCKHLRRRFPEVKLVVGLWDLQGDLTKASERIGCGATVVATMADAQEKVRLLIQQQLRQTTQSDDFREPENNHAQWQDEKTRLLLTTDEPTEHATP